MNLTSLGIFAVLFLMIMSIVSNVSATSIAKIEHQIFLFNCPLPINGGTALNTNINGLTVNYTLSRDNSSAQYRLGIFDCTFTNDTQPNCGTCAVSVTTLTTTNNWFNVGQSYLAYTMNVIFSIIQKMQAFLALFSFIITPANFNIFGFTLSSLSGMALMAVIFVYLICYILIGAWLYSTLMPFKGGD